MNWMFTREEVPLRILPSGHMLTAPLFRLQAAGKKKCYIQANTHGGEIAGNGAIFALIQKLISYDINGTMIIVPHCNPVSLNNQIDHEQQGVYDAATGQNWNRLFKLPADLDGTEWRVNIREFARSHAQASWDEIKVEFRREIAWALERLRESASTRGLEYSTHVALQFQSLSFDTDIVLDLHTGDLAPRYLYAPEYALKSAPYFRIPHVLAMKNEFAGAFDEVNFCPWWTLWGELKALGRTDIQLDIESYTVELGSLERIDPADMEEDAERILNYLKFRGMVSGEAVKPTEPVYCCNMEDYLSYVSPASGLAVIAHPPGAMLKAGDQIGYILTMRNFHQLDRPEQAQTPIILQEDGILITRKVSPSVFDGQVLFKMMTNYRTLEIP